MVMAFVPPVWAPTGQVIPRKWMQRPDIEQGVNIQSTLPEPLVADDWRCLDGRPLVDLHWWGSYLGWQMDNPRPLGDPPGVRAFRIAIYADGPADPWSQPGELLYEDIYDDFTEVYYDTIAHTDPSGRTIYEHKFYYTIRLHRPFPQQKDAIYWISIAALQEPGESVYWWGWETSLDHWRDDAVKGYRGETGAWTWEKLGYYDQENVWHTYDMAFALTTYLDTRKWSQRPDMRQGINIRSVEPQPLVADDWKCLDGKPLIDLHWWGSYIGWEKESPQPPSTTPGVAGFRIRIYADVPAGQDPEMPWSHPGELLYQQDYRDFSERYYGTITYTTSSGTYYEHVYYYSIDLKPFQQTQGSIYWLSISALPAASNQWPWGWETSLEHWNDDAVTGVPSADPPWRELRDQAGRSLDMAFELTTRCYTPAKWIQIPDMEAGVDIESMTPQPIVADDWRCLSGAPVYRIHWWGSYPGWREDEPRPTVRPPRPSWFKISIHKDSPLSSPEMPWSHPGELLYEERSEDFVQIYYGSIPHVGPEGKVRYEHKFYYQLRLKEPFVQQAGNVYWLDIAAGPLPIPELRWGWATSSQHWRDDAVQGHLRPDGSWFWQKQGYYDEKGIWHTYDMSFILATQVDPCEGDFDYDGDVDGSDLILFARNFGRTDCNNIGTFCQGDFDGDGDVDGSDLAIFASDFGRNNCPPCWPPRR